jgi:SAM-dependent methyltransferase
MSGYLNATRKLIGAIRPTSSRIKRRLSGQRATDPHATDAASPTTPTPSLPTAVPRPLPEGWSEEDIRTVMLSFQIDGSAPGSLDPYVHDALWRFLHTWGLVRGDQGRCLELGGNPYFITWLLREFTNLDVELANYFSQPEGIYHQRWQYNCRGIAVDETLPFRQFNLEEDRFPYDDDTFEVVIFCEILEHLLMDPMRCLREIHRVLVPGGRLVLSTPNVARLGNVLTMVEGGNIYDPYSGYGPYGRHNREYNRHELHRLLEFAGFGELSSFTADAHPSGDRTRAGFDAVAPLLAGRSADLGQYVFVSARSSGSPRAGLPTMLYRSWPDDQLVDY